MCQIQTLVVMARSVVRASVASFTPWGVLHSGWVVLPKAVVGIAWAASGGVVPYVAAALRANE